MQVIADILFDVVVIVAFIAIVVLGFRLGLRTFRRPSARTLLARHFAPTALERLTITESLFPASIRVELSGAINRLIDDCRLRSFHGLRSSMHALGGIDFSMLLDESLLNSFGGNVLCPPQYEQIDIGEAEPVQSLKSGLWLLVKDREPLAVLLAPTSDIGECGVAQRIRLQIVTRNDAGGSELARNFIRHMETEIGQARCYRGKVLSLEPGDSYLGQSSGIKVHRLEKLAREELILPQKTIELLDRNVISFARHRKTLGTFQMARKKGILFYGPPGTGKTHTIRYLAGSLPGHTTLLITAEQISLLGEYITLGRLLQPSVIVIEDVDLIARDRTRTASAGTEMMLNKLLNEMDGLREDCEMLFILTTNRPRDLEDALASRPGRIDQAIEFSLPDAPGRAKLIRLYARGIDVSEDLVHEIVQRTEGVSASFIKELMRRTAQFHLERNGAGRFVAVGRGVRAGGDVIQRWLAESEIAGRRKSTEQHLRAEQLAADSNRRWPEGSSIAPDRSHPRRASRRKTSTPR